mmetsp:Transcript_54224/g.117210  ORF Transcript_54224/g.117210 Transcript_54224/m.117210 type:complete len:417 (-) Transcript_54224:110-1360(-)
MAPSPPEEEVPPEGCPKSLGHATSFEADFLKELQLPSLRQGASLGKGTSGEVRRVLETIDGGSYALKMVRLPGRRSGTTATEDAIAPPLLLHEVRLHRLCSAGCSSIARYAFSWISGCSMVILMEACDAALWDVLTTSENALDMASGLALPALGKRQLTQEDRQGITVDLCEATNHIHRLRVMHRDVNPWNALIVRDRCGASPSRPPRLLARLSDFGLAVQLPAGVDEVEGYEVAGASPLDDSALTSLYSAPELGHRYGLSVDVFSLGMTLLALWASKTLRGEEKLINAVEATKGASDISSRNLNGAPPGSCQNDASPRADVKSLLVGADAPLLELIPRMVAGTPAFRPDAAAVLQTLRAAAVDAEVDPTRTPTPLRQADGSSPLNVGGTAEAPKAPRSLTSYFRCFKPQRVTSAA